VKKEKDLNAKIEARLKEIEKILNERFNIKCDGPNNKVTI
jgi:hypothetical protein